MSRRTQSFLVGFALVLNVGGVPNSSSPPSKLLNGHSVSEWEAMKTRIVGTTGFKRRVSLSCLVQDQEKEDSSCSGRETQRLFCKKLHGMKSVPEVYAYFCTVQQPPHKSQPSALGGSSAAPTVKTRTAVADSTSTAHASSIASSIKVKKVEDQARTTSAKLSAVAPAVKRHKAETGVRPQMHNRFLRQGHGMATFAGVRARLMEGEVFKSEAKGLADMLGCGKTKKQVACTAFVDEAVFCLAFADQLKEFSKLEGAAGERQKCHQIEDKLPALKRDPLLLRKAREHRLFTGK